MPIHPLAGKPAPRTALEVPAGKSFKDQAHLDAIVREAQGIVGQVLSERS